MCDGPPEHCRVDRFCTRAAHCPVCGKPNGCRLETGEAYKGKCWCEGPILPAAALNRLLAELPEPRCLCRTCLEKIAGDPEIAWETLAAQAPDSAGDSLPGDTYLEGVNLVFPIDSIRPISLGD